MSYIFMNLNGEAEIIRQLVSFTHFYDGISLPLHPDNKATVDAFFGKSGAFVLLCDKIFGKAVDNDYDNEQAMSWMDLANVSPRSPLAKALFRCVSPGTPFINFLEAISTPSPTFPSKIRQHWKSSRSSTTGGTNGKADEQVIPAYTVDFPLSSFLQNSFRLLGENSDADLYTFTRAKIPGALLIPFWHPPLATRKEPSTQQVMTSLPCSPLSYFVLRLLMYAICRSERDGAAVLSRRQYRGVRSCLRYCEDSVAWILNRLPPTEFPFFSDVFTAYVQIYLTPSLSQGLASKVSVEDYQWTTSDVTAALLVCSSSLLSHRHVSQPMLERNRTPVYEPSQLAPIAVVMPFLTEMHIALHKGAGGTHEAMFASAVPTNFSDDGAFKAADDLLYLNQTLYRNALIAMRESLLSFDGFPRCRSMHFNNVLELWLTLMNPLWRVNSQVSVNYVARHYEAYSVLTVGILQLSTKSGMIGALDRSGVDLLVKCFNQLQEQAFSGLADAVHLASKQMEESVVINSIKRNCVLNWSDDGEILAVMDVRSPQVCDKAAQLFVAIESYMAAEEFSPTTERYRQSLIAIAASFPGAKDFLDNWRQRGSIPASTTTPQAPRRASDDVDYSIVDTSRCMTETEKEKFFKGTKRSCSRYSAKVRLATNNGRVHGGHHPTSKATMYLELPALIGFTRILDAGIERLMDAYYSKWIPRCEVGHSMILVNTDRYCCSVHPASVGIWECTICETVFGNCCRPLPMVDGGIPAYMKRNSDLSTMCCRCGELIEVGGICFASPERQTHMYCPDCASRPFKPISTRFLAAYSFWAVVVVVSVVYCFLVAPFFFSHDQ